jgi:hypothetical protein
MPVNGRKRKGLLILVFVSDRDKDLVWRDVLLHFGLNTNDEELKKRVRDWSMKKTATQF